MTKLAFCNPNELNRIELKTGTNVGSVFCYFKTSFARHEQKRWKSKLLRINGIWKGSNRTMSQKELIYFPTRHLKKVSKMAKNDAATKIVVLESVSHLKKVNLQ